MIKRQRVVPLDGASNLRDLGGYAAEDGRTIRWGILYRSAHLAGLTEEGAAEWAALGIRTICDLRYEAERMEHRTPAVCMAACRTEVLNLRPRHEVLIKELVRRGATGDHGPRELMQLVYRSLPLEHSTSYAKLLECAANPSGVPLLFHCTAGKDRTGFGAALLLRTLGVPMATVIDDYLLTNGNWRGTGVLKDLSAEMRLALGGAHAEYLEASFKAIDEHYGSLDRYLEKALAFGTPRVAALRDTLLDSHEEES
jgi:protein-tyrosine phosphatase